MNNGNMILFNKFKSVWCGQCYANIIAMMSVQVAAHHRHHCLMRQLIPGC